MTTVITAPTHYAKRIGRQSLFLAGGITNCLDWQRDFIFEFGQCKDVDILNPRREQFDIEKQEIAKQQIEWEFDMLQLADVIVFWFAPETLCPITLFELGIQLGRRQIGARTPELIIGCSYMYEREFDVTTQTRLVLGPHTKIYHNVDDLTRRAREHFGYRD